VHKTRKLTLSDLASLAGVSTSTASRALNNNPIIKQATRDKLHALAEKHNFSLNTTASRLRTQRTNVIAVILNLIDHTEQSVSDPFLLKVVGDLNQVLNRHGYELLLSNSFMAKDNWANHFIKGQRADGLIVVGQGKDDKKVRLAADSGAPMVVWGAPDSSDDYPIVGSDNQLGGYLATQHLIAGGCNKVVFLGDPEHTEMKERFIGYKNALKDAGIANEDNFTLPIDITSQAAYQKISDTILRQGLFFDGIVASSDMVALGALKALKERYIGIPNEVAIVGFDDIAMAELFHPSLTTIRQNTKKAAEIMVETLLNQFKQRTIVSSTLEIELIVRNSSRLP